MRGKFPQDKFLEDAGNATFSNPDQRVLQQQTGTAIACRIVKIGDTTGCKGSDNRRVVRLIALIVALANHGIAERVQNPRSSGTGSSVKIPWILFQERGQDCAIDERTYKSVSVGCAEAFRIAFCTLPVSTVIIRRLLKSSKGAYAQDGNGIYR